MINLRYKRFFRVVGYELRGCDVHEAGSQHGNVCKSHYPPGYKTNPRTAYPPEWNDLKSRHCASLSKTQDKEVSVVPTNEQPTTPTIAPDADHSESTSDPSV